MSIWITNAPPVYDYEWTVLSSDPVAARMILDRPDATPFRRVELDDREDGYYVEYQCNRYRSGGYRVMSLERYEQEIREGYLVNDERR